MFNQVDEMYMPQFVEKYYPIFKKGSWKKKFFLFPKKCNVTKQKLWLETHYKFIYDDYSIFEFPTTYIGFFHTDIVLQIKLIMDF